MKNYILITYNYKEAIAVHELNGEGKSFKDSVEKAFFPKYHRDFYDKRWFWGLDENKKLHGQAGHRVLESMLRMHPKAKVVVLENYMNKKSH